MKKILIVVYIILLLILIKLSISFVINEAFISTYNDEIYNSNNVERLFVLNIFQPYIAHYNHGNILYYNNDLDGAIEEYERALELFPPEDKERDIIINLELAKLKKENDTDNTNEEDKEEDKKENKEKEKEKKTDKVEEQLVEIQKESNEQRQDNLQDMQQLDREYKYYPGKRW